MHCKAGKGRAGLMCCVLLLRAGVVNSAAEAFKKYDATRVTNNKGLTVTSQRKYVKVL
jgi:phosphatidylinositol-3,4,5-trisphosphate 3-phosphatase/dual-specificity protein phosphatase PTEN